MSLAHIKSASIRPVAATLFLVVAAHTGCAQASPATVIVPIETRGDMILVPVAVNGKSTLLILDTGSGVSVLDSAFAKEVALDMTGPRATVVGTRNTSMQLGKANTVRVGAAELTGILVAPVSLSDVQARVGYDVRGSIGYELFSRYVVTLDFQARTMTLQGPREFSYSGTGVVLPVSIANRHPVATVSIVTRTRGTIPAQMTLDLGSTSYAMRFATGFVEKFGLADDTTTLEGPFGAGVDGVTEGRLLRFPELRLGTLRIERPSAALSHERAGAFGDHAQADGTIGMPVFKRTRMIIDYSRSRVILEPLARLDLPDTVTTSGLTLVTTREPPALRVAYVINGSPAALAGVRVGDELLAIDGAPTLSLSAFQASELLRGAGVSRRLRLRRGTQTIEVSIALRMVF